MVERTIRSKSALSIDSALGRSFFRPYVGFDTDRLLNGRGSSRNELLLEASKHGCPLIDLLIEKDNKSLTIGEITGQIIDTGERAGFDGHTAFFFQEFGLRPKVGQQMKHGPNSDAVVP